MHIEQRAFSVEPFLSNVSTAYHVVCDPDLLVAGLALFYSLRARPCRDITTHLAVPDRQRSDGPGENAIRGSNLLKDVNPRSCAHTKIFSDQPQNSTDV